MMTSTMTQCCIRTDIVHDSSSDVNHPVLASPNIGCAMDTVTALTAATSAVSAFSSVALSKTVTYRVGQKRKPRNSCSYLHHILIDFYRAMHIVQSAVIARYCYRKSSVCLSVRP